MEAVKGLVLGGLFVMTFICSAIPVKFYNLTHEPDAARHRRGKRAISFLSCFAAGVFLATCLLHLFPDVDNDLAQVLDRLNIFSSFPVAEFVMCFGFFMILVIEQVVLTMKERHDIDDDGHHHHGGAHHHHHQNPEHKPLLTTSKDGHSPVKNYGNGHVNIEQDSSSINSEDLNSSTNEGPFPTMMSSGEHSSNTDYSVHVDQSSHSTIRSFILLLALSLHAVFEGLAVGLQTTKNGVIQIFSALVLHKCILGFSLGLNLVQSRLSRGACLRGAFVFSIMSPIGIAIGIIVDDVSDSIAANLASGILQGIACGTFLYVTFFEVLPHEFNSKDDRMLKVLFLILGYSTLVAILFLDPDNDSVPRCSGLRPRPVDLVNPNGGYS